MNIDEISPYYPIDERCFNYHDFVQFKNLKNRRSS